MSPGIRWRRRARTVWWWLTRPVHRLRLHLGWYPVVRNVNQADERRLARRALLLYRLRPFQIAATSREFLEHHNMRRARRIAALLGEFGYVVDAANGRNARLRRPSGRYDVIVSDRADLRGSFPSGTRLVFLATSMHHRVRNANLARRHDRLAERRRCRIAPRQILSGTLSFARRAGAIIAIGNDVTAGSWREVSAGPIHTFDTAAFDGTARVDRDFATARRHFLFFASRTQVLKGLDLLLEIFPRHPDLHLHVCSQFRLEPDFCACYRRELFETRNIHPIGWTTVNSGAFYDLARTAAFVIHPSCAEGQASSVIQCMATGLIPIVTRETGVDTDQAGVTMGDDLASIEQTILDVAGRPPGWHREQSRSARQIAEIRYSEAAFTARWRTILTEVLGHRAQEP